MAKRKEVLLIKDVLKLGNMGDIVRVSPGFARNYLFPYGMAIAAGDAAKRQIEVLREKAAKSEGEREHKALGLKKSMEGMSIQIAARVAHDAELFGSIGIKEIVAALAKSGIEVDSKQVHLHDKLRRLGSYSVEIRLHKNVPVTIKLEIVNSDPNAPALDEALAAAAKNEKPEKAEKPEKGEKADKGDKTDKGDKEPSAKGDKHDKHDKNEKGKSGDKHDKNKAGAKDDAKGSKKDSHKAEAAAKKTVKA
ncbi:MAG: 50S ribosomal protein L9 [Planctomycetes bacterium]|nr:50S ribosomal protein L9 [Planctomycetota bacterium]